MSKHQTFETPKIAGQGGGKGGGGGPPVESPNTLRSKSTARIIDLLGEGEIGGLIDGLKSVYLDETPVQNSDGSYNFEGIRIHERKGTPDQPYIKGFPAAEREVVVNTEVKFNSPIVRTINDLDTNAVRCKVRIPALSKQITDGDDAGDLRPYQVSVAVEVRQQNGTWIRPETSVISGKNTSPYEESYLIPLTGEGPWQVRMLRLSPDNDDDSAIQSSTFFSTYTEITNAKIQYADSAVLGVEVDAQQFGDQIPERAYEVAGTLIQVPTNYDPDTREYTGIWDGTFKLAVSDNPAWILYDLATNTRYGAGLPNVSKEDLYVIAKYCDELVPDGFGGMEPRYTINTVISSREDAYKVLNAVASAAKAKLHWASNQLIVTQDAPTPPTRQFSETNVVRGEFKYSGSAKKARHNVVNVMWNDPDDQYRQAVERVEDPVGIRNMDEIVEAEITAFGCTRRSQARRAGLWKLFTERNETDVVEFDATNEVYDMQPNEVIEIYDRFKQGIRLGGRVVYTAVNDLELDKVPDLSQGTNWHFSVMMPNGGIITREIQNTTGNVVHLTQDLPDVPVGSAQWTMTANEVKPQLYRVLKIVDNNDHTYTITAQMHDPNKFAELENDVVIDDEPNTLIPTGPLLTPTNVNITTYTYVAGGTTHQAINVSFTPADDPRVIRYQIQHRSPADYVYKDVVTTVDSSIDVRDVEQGEHSFRVRSVDGNGRYSVWTSATNTIQSLLLPKAPTGVEVSVGNFEITLRPYGKPLQEYEYWRSDVAITTGQILSNSVYLGSGRYFSDTGLLPDTTYYYYVRGVNAYGTSTWFPVQATTDLNPDTIMDVISEQIRETDLYKDLRDRIALIDGPASVNGTVNARLAALEALSDQNDALIEQMVDDLDVTLTSVNSDTVANSNAIDAIDVRVTNNEDNISTQAQRITALQSSLSDSNGDRVVTADAFDILKTQVQVNENEISSRTQDITQINSSLTDINSEIVANADALDILSTEVSQIDGTLTTAINDITTLQASIDDQNAAIEQKASIDSVTDLETGITDISAQWTIKTDVNGNVAGIGLMNDGATSRFIINAEEFAVIDPASDQEVFPFIIQNGLVYLSEGVFGSATIGNAAIKDGSITNAKIGNVIESDSYVPNQSGWKINKVGNIEINNLKGRGVIEGSEIRGSTITGSAIIGSAFLSATDLDPGDNRYVALTSTLNWTQNLNINGWAWHELMDIASANNTNSNIYRRFRRRYIDASVRIYSQYPSPRMRVICYYELNGNRSVIGDTGLMEYYDQPRSGANWTASTRRFSSEECYTTCAGTNCNTWTDGMDLRFNLNNYSFTGNGRIRFRVYSEDPATSTATTTAYNDY